MRLLEDSAGDARPARLIGIVICRRMNDQGASLQIAEFQPGCGYRQGGGAIGGYRQHGQIALVAMAVRPQMLASLVWVIMTARRQTCLRLAVFHARLTSWLLVEMEAMRPGRQPS